MQLGWSCEHVLTFTLSSGLSVPAGISGALCQGQNCQALQEEKIIYSHIPLSSRTQPARPLTPVLCAPFCPLPSRVMWGFFCRFFFLAGLISRWEFLDDVITLAGG